MASRWTFKQERKYKHELRRLYVSKNLSIGEISRRLFISESQVYKRLLRLDIPIQRHLKALYNNTSQKVIIPSGLSEELAEFFGIMLGDGHISPTQVIVTLGSKEIKYVEYVAQLIKSLFKIEPKIFNRRETGRQNRYRNVYFGSVTAVRWLMDQGFVHNKVRSQVGVPQWIFSKKEFMEAFIKGFFDTDGSFYKLRFGIQISFTNRSFPILFALQRMLKSLEYKPSRVSGFHLYLTRQGDVRRFFQELQPSNSKHLERFRNIA